MYLEDHSKTAGVTADPFSLDALIAWLRTKPAEEAYEWYGETPCLIDQYLDAAGIEVTSTNYLRVCEWEDRIEVACRRPHTFGAALSRALALKEGAQ